MARIMGSFLFNLQPIPLAFGTGKSGFYEKLGFTVAGKPSILGNGTIEGVSQAADIEILRIYH